MSRGKPANLLVSHRGRNALADRAELERALTPSTPLPKEPPAELKGMPHARATWRRLVALFELCDPPIVNGFDRAVLVLYCQLDEGIWTLHQEREDSLKRLEAAQAAHRKTRFCTKAYFDTFKDVDKAIGEFLSLDARVDRRCKLQLDVARSLYLTPKSRDGVAPTLKDTTPPDEMDKWLDERFNGI